MDVSLEIQRISEVFSGTIGFAAKNLSTGEEIRFNSDQLFGTASTIKVPILVEVLRRVREGELSLDTRVPLMESNVVGGSGILKEFAAQLQPTILDLCTMMIIVSDNTATNLLLDLVGGTEAVNHTMRAYGLHHIHLHNRIDFGAIGMDVRRFAEASPADMMALMERIVQGEVVDEETSKRILEIMSRQQYLDQVPRYLKFDPYASDLNTSQSIAVFCKTGFFPGTRVDTGAIFLPNETKIVYCAMTEASTDLNTSIENEGNVINGLLGRLVVTHWWPNDSPPAVLDTPHLGILARLPL